MKKIVIKSVSLILVSLLLFACNNISTTENANNSEKTVSDKNEVSSEIRVLTERVSKGNENDIVNGVTNFDISKIWKPVDNIDFSSKHDTLIMNSDGSLVPMDEPYYECEEVFPHTYRIRTDGDYCYLIEGDEIGIMIDTGYGAGNIRKYAEDLINKPVKYVINTHYHFDHSANDPCFDVAFMSEESIPYATVPYKSFDGIDFNRNYPIIAVEDGYKINLGNRELQIIDFLHPNHTVGSIAILDKQNKLLWTGDEFLFPSRIELKYATIEDYLKSLEHINEYRKDFDYFLAGTGVKEASTFDTYLTTTKNAILGVEDIEKEETSTQKSNWKKPEIPEGTSHTIYVRGSVRDGDGTDNPPEKMIVGESKSYKYDGFTINYIVPN